MNRLRLGFAIAGFILAIVSVTLNDNRLAWGAIALLTASLILRLLLRKQQTNSGNNR
jgi:hypothetical protein